MTGSPIDALGKDLARLSNVSWEDLVASETERILRNAAGENNPGFVLDMVVALLPDLRPDIAVAVLKTVGHAMPVNDDWRARLVERGLSCDNEEVRDAALDMGDLWKDVPSVRNMLESHVETDSFLADYLEQILADLSPPVPNPGAVR